MKRRARTAHRTVLTTLGAALPAVALVALAGLVPASSASGAAALASWPQFGRTPAHPGDAPAEDAFTTKTVGSLGEAWRAGFGTNASSFGGAAVVNGVAYVAGSDGVLSAFSTAACATGSCTPLWRATIPDGRIFGTPAVVGGRVYVGANDHFLYAFRASGCGAATCPPLFRGQVADAILGGVAVDGGQAFVGDFGGKLYAFPAAGCGKAVCRPTWTATTGPNEEVTNTPAVGGGHVFVSTFFNTPDDVSGRLHSYAVGGCGNRPACPPEWTADLLGPAGDSQAPVVSGTTVFAGSGTRFAETPNGPEHLFAFSTGGCGRKTCQPLRSYRTGDSDLTGGLAVSGGVIYASSQSTPDPNTVGVVTAFPARGCGAAECDPLWTGINFAAGFESPPLVTQDVVFVAKGPASGFPVDEAVLSYPAKGCGSKVCEPLSFTSVGDQQFYLGQPLAAAEHTLFVVTGVTGTGADELVALQVKPS